MKHLIPILAIAAVTLPAVTTGLLAAQDRVPQASQHGTVSQTITGTTITVEYDRPAARGRELFGGLVSWGEWWTPGANWATTIEADGDFALAGHNLAAGRYSLWFIVQPQQWTVIVSADDHLFHTQRPDSGREAARFSVTPQPAGQYLDALAFYFPTVGPHYTTLAFHWGDTMVQFDIRVPEYPHVSLARGEGARYVGTYQRDDGRTVTVRDEDGILSVAGLGRFAMHLVPLGDHRFAMGTFIGNELATVLPGQGVLVFSMAGERATGFGLLRDGTVRSRGTRR